MNEQQVRELLYQTEIRRIISETPRTRVIDEFVLLRGAARADVAVINDSLHAYEIKSAMDKLDRLPSQQAAYEKVFERITLVSAERHVGDAVKLVPRCWGLIVVGLDNGKAYANEIWPATRNCKLDRLALAQLLWHDEAIELMDYFGLARGMRDKPRKVLWQKLAGSLSTEELKAFVCFKLRTRQNWR